MKLIYAALQDLFFHAKIKTTAEKTGAEVVFSTSYDELMENIMKKKPDLLIVDLNGFMTPAHVSSARSRGINVLGYLSHVQTDVRKNYQSSCDRIMTNSEFSQKLAEILSG